MPQFSLDIWINVSSIRPLARSAAIGYGSIGSICSPNKYSIMENTGLSIINNAADELGHM